MRVKSPQAAVLEGARTSSDFDGARLGRAQAAATGRYEPIEPTCRRTGADRPAWTSTIQVRSGACAARRDRRGHDDGGPATRAHRRPVGPPGHLGPRPGDLRRGDSYTRAASTSPSRRPPQLAEATSGARRAAGATTCVVTAPFERRQVAEPRTRVGRGGRGRDPLRGRPLPRRSATSATPTPSTALAHTSAFDVDKAMRALDVRAHVGAVEAAEAAPKTPYEYVLAGQPLPAAAGFTLLRAPGAGAGRARAAGRLPVRHKEGYCQHFSGAMALLLRMGGVPARVATGFSPGGYSKRNKAWIVRDTDAHAWVEAWFDELRLGHVRPDAGRHARRARRSPRSRTCRRSPTTAARRPTPPARAAERRRPAPPRPGVRADLLHDPLAGATTAPAGAIDAGTPWWQWVVGAVVVLMLLGPRCCRSCAARAARGLTGSERALVELEAALRRAGRPAADGHDAAPARAAAGHVARAVGYLRALSAGALRPAPAPPTRAQRRGLRRALAPGWAPARRGARAGGRSRRAGARAPR